MCIYIYIYSPSPFVQIQTEIIRLCLHKVREPNESGLENRRVSNEIQKVRETNDKKFIVN